MGKPHQDAALTEEDRLCFACPLSDCHPTHPGCPVLRQKLEAKGLPLPEPAEASAQKIPARGRPKKIIVAEAKDRKEYQQKYQKEYHSLHRRRVLLKGIKVRKCDLDTLQAVCARDGRTLEGEIMMLLEFMAGTARAAWDRTPEEGGQSK